MAALTAPEPLELVARRDFGEVTAQSQEITGSFANCVGELQRPSKAFEEVYRPLGYRPAAIGKTKSFAATLAAMRQPATPRIFWSPFRQSEVKASSTWLFMACPEMHLELLLASEKHGIGSAQLV